MNGFSLRRLYSLLRKEWIQVRRDPMTLRLIIALPIMQLFLFGYAINTNPRHLPTGLLISEPSKYDRTIVTALQNTGYYDVRLYSSEAKAEHALAAGEALFIINIPANFDRSVDRGEQPSILIDADATDPSAIGNAAAALGAVVNDINRDLPPIRQTQPASPPFQFVVHARYNPEQLTVLNVVPGLICIVLTMSTLLITTLSITRERERGTMENLMAMPVRPIEIMLAKIVPYVVIGYIQAFIILVISALVFQLPVRGSVSLLMLALGLFISSNLALGLTFSTVSTNQMQAQQLAQFTLLPSFMLSGFMFPFQGMPVWAQRLGEIFPTTHAIRIVRGVLLKGNGAAAIASELWPIALFTLLVLGIAVWFYRETLD
jgi:ABC-type multidrug transport system permease subunit